MAEDENQQQSKDNPYSFNAFLSRGSQNFDDVGDENRSTETKNAHSRYSYQEKSKSSKMDLFEDEEEEDEEENPFSFKEFLKNEKRTGIYISEEDEVSDDLGEDMGNQNGSVPPSPQPGTSVDGRPNQRRATSPGLPSRHKHKPAAKGPPSEPAEGATPPATPKKTRNRPQGVPPPGQDGDFVDFIYDYATSKNGDLDGGKVASSSGQKKVKNGARYSFGDTDAPALPEKKLYARERARAHTHGHPVRKHKNGPSKPHPKSQLVVDYIDATGDDASMFSAASASELHTRGNDSDPILDELSRPKAEVKPHRERARAHSHGHRKQKSGEKQSKTKSSSDQQTDREAKHYQKTHSGENGNVRRADYERKASPVRKEASEYDQPRSGGSGAVPVKSHSVPDILSDPYDSLPPRNQSPSSCGSASMSTSPTEDGGQPEALSADVAKLKQDNSRLRSELSEARRINERDAKRIDTMEEELKRLRLREAEDAKTLEAMVQHVEANLKRTTERAVSAENTITTLKKEIKSLKSENSTLVSENKKFKEGKDILELRERAHTASLKLAGAAKDAESNLKQLMAGVDILKLMAETLACFDKLSEHTDESRPGRKGYGTAL